MHIVKKTEPITVEHPVFHIIGDPGLGKTTLVGMADRPLLLDFDLGSHRAHNRPDTIPVSSWSDVAELMQGTDALAEYATVGVDTVGRCLDLMAAEIMRTEPKMGKGGNLSQQGWGVLKMRFRSWLNELRGLGKDVILLSHAKEEKDGDQRIVRADIAGGSYSEIMRVADFVGYLSMVGRDRVLDFSPTDRAVGKNPAGWDPWKVPHFAKEPLFMAKLISDGRAALGKIGEAGAQAMAQLADWEAKILEATDADTLNALGPLVAKVQPPILLAQVRALLSARAKTLGLEADKAAKKYKAPKPAEAQVTA